MDQQTSVFTRENFGAPPGGQGMFLPQRKILTGIYLPSRWERMKIERWSPFKLTIPSNGIGANGGLWTLAAGETQQFSASCPVYFAINGFSVWFNQKEGAQVSIYEELCDQALVNPFGTPLSMSLLGGTAKKHFWLKEFLFLDPGDTLFADITNLSPNPQVGQVVVEGSMPLDYQ
jgi:hypothetical protein